MAVRSWLIALCPINKFVVVDVPRRPSAPSGQTVPGARISTPHRLHSDRSHRGGWDGLWLSAVMSINREGSSGLEAVGFQDAVAVLGDAWPAVSCECHASLRAHVASFQPQLDHAGLQVVIGPVAAHFPVVARIPPRFCCVCCAIANLNLPDSTVEELFNMLHLHACYYYSLAHAYAAVYISSASRSTDAAVCYSRRVASS